MKTCSKCHVAKASECFRVRHYNRCKSCVAAGNKKRHHRVMQTTNGRLLLFYNSCKTRHANKKHEGELITLKRFKAIYQAQGGLCAETGVPFDLQSKVLMPSPDRIDNNAGYIDGNIRFVTWRINNMRNNLSIERFQSICMEVAEPNKSMPVVMADDRLRFKKTYKGCKERHEKKHEGELITFERYNAIYQAQGGVCADTGVPFDWASDLMPSPDRIDNAVGYTDGNIRFVTWRVNLMRGGLSIEDFQATCMQVVQQTHYCRALLMLPN